MSEKLTIALDAMGGDNAPHCVVQGVEIALQRYSNVRFLFFGNKAAIEPLFKQHPAVERASEIVHTEVSIAAHEKPSVALRRGAGSSMRLAIDAVKEGKAHCVVSAGNTGALMAMSKLVFRTLPGISRPAIAALVPTIKGDAVMLDLGANIESNAAELVQFAIMGDAFARIMLSRPSPKIGLLNVGSEEMKGHDEIKEAYTLLRNNAGIDFHGFVEGNDIAEGTVDVVVTDGFTGNVALKTAEGVGRMVSHYVNSTFRSSWRSKLGYLLARPAIARLRKSLDPRRRNGAMFLGLGGVAIKSHGSADGYGYYRALRVAIELVSSDINTKILEELKISNPAESK
ncbi:MAG TPA: phosphate acyltransferase PlsX [Rickettsiales bacterium]|nr:phosphate acyltransferase PlsX [Rickettsiales bacterium]